MGPSFSSLGTLTGQYTYIRILDIHSHTYTQIVIVVATVWCLLSSSFATIQKSKSPTPVLLIPFGIVRVLARVCVVVVVLVFLCPTSQQTLQFIYNLNSEVTIKG